MLNVSILDQLPLIYCLFQWQTRPSYYPTIPQRSRFSSLFPGRSPSSSTHLRLSTTIFARDFIIKLDLITTVCWCWLLKRRRRIAVRWSAPEVLLGRQHTPSSNVWSYAVLAWEVLSLGQTPFDRWDDDQVATAVTAGAVLPRPSVRVAGNSCTR